MSIAHQYTETIHTPHYLIEVSPSTLYGYFEHRELGDERGGGLWFEQWNILHVLIDADGTACVPTEVCEALTGRGYTVPQEFFIREPAGIPTTETLRRGLDACGPWYRIAKRDTGIGGGFNLEMLLNGEPAGGGVFPADDADPAALVTALNDATETGSEWRDAHTARPGKA